MRVLETGILADMFVHLIFNSERYHDHRPNTFQLTIDLASLISESLMQPPILQNMVHKVKTDGMMSTGFGISD